MVLKVLFKRIFLKWQLPRCANGNFPKVRFIGSLRRRRVQWRPRAAARMDYWGRALWLEQAGGRLPRLGQTWEVAAREIANLTCSIWLVERVVNKKGMYDAQWNPLKLCILQIEWDIHIFTLKTDYFQSFKKNCRKIIFFRVRRWLMLKLYNFKRC